MRLLLAGILILTLGALPSVARSSSDAELEGLTAILGQVQSVDREARVVRVDRVRIRVPANVAGFELLRAGQHVVVHLNPEARDRTATSIEVVSQPLR
jgi:hypothetical protein